ncbi:porin family protein [Flavobacterium sp.]|uniref:porin family protein n=1 Tax=Flavobacterium sp. TaxID=239 RepID=UPI0039E56379
MNTLKKTVCALMILAAANASAQGEPIKPTADGDNRDQFGFGIRAGLNISNVYDEEGEDFIADSKTGFYGGAFVSVPLGTIIGIQPEVIYSQKGFKATGTFLGGSYDFERTTSYLDIPLQLSIKPIPQLTFLVGPQFSYLLETKDDFNEGTITLVQEEEITDDNYKKGVIGAVVGVETNWKGLFVSARGGWDITKTDTDGDSTSPRYKNQVIQFGLGYTFY